MGTIGDKPPHPTKKMVTSLYKKRFSWKKWPPTYGDSKLKSILVINIYFGVRSLYSIRYLEIRMVFNHGWLLSVKASQIGRLFSQIFDQFCAYYRRQISIFSLIQVHILPTTDTFRPSIVDFFYQIYTIASNVNLSLYV